MDFHNLENIAEEVAAIGGGIAGFRPVRVNGDRREFRRGVDAQTSGENALVACGDIIHLQRDVGVTENVDASVRVLRLRAGPVIFEHLDMGVAKAADELVGGAAF